MSDAILLSEENVKKYVLSKFNLKNFSVEQIKFKNTEKQRAVYKVTNESTSFCLKKIYFSMEELLFVYSSIEWLYRYNIKVPRILPSVDKKRYVEYNKMLFILTPWIDGEKFDYDNIENVLSGIRNLANMHNACTNFQPIEGSKLRKGFDSIYQSTLKHFQQLLVFSNNASSMSDEYSKTYSDNFHSIEELASISSLVAASINDINLSSSLCHMDYVNKNLLFDKNNNIWVIDFDKCRIDYSVHDISYYLRRMLKRDNTNWDISILINTLDEYDKIRELNFDEYKYILVYLSFPQKIWKLTRDYYKNYKKCNKTAFNVLLQKAVENNDSQIKFTNQFISYIEDKFNTKIESH